MWMDGAVSPSAPTPMRRLLAPWSVLPWEQLPPQLGQLPAAVHFMRCHLHSLEVCTHDHTSPGGRKEVPPTEAAPPRAEQSSLTKMTSAASWPTSFVNCRRRGLNSWGGPRSS